MALGIAERKMARLSARRKNIDQTISSRLSQF
jgi:hypothetical protein